MALALSVLVELFVSHKVKVLERVIEKLGAYLAYLTAAVNNRWTGLDWTGLEWTGVEKIVSNTDLDWVGKCHLKTSITL